MMCTGCPRCPLAAIPPYVALHALPLHLTINGPLPRVCSSGPCKANHLHTSPTCSTKLHTHSSHTGASHAHPPSPLSLSTTAPIRTPAPGTRNSLFSLSPTSLFPFELHACAALRWAVPSPHPCHGGFPSRLPACLLLFFLSSSSPPSIAAFARHLSAPGTTDNSSPPPSLLLPIHQYHHHYGRVNDTLHFSPCCTPPPLSIPAGMLSLIPPFSVTHSDLRLHRTISISPAHQSLRVHRSRPSPPTRPSAAFLLGRVILEPAGQTLLVASTHDDLDKFLSFFSTSELL